MKPHMPPLQAMGQPTVFMVFMLTASVSAVLGFENAPIRTTHGDVRGQVTSVLGRQVKVYWGIPYAEIPARFQRPQRSLAWKGILEATIPPPSCPEVPYVSDLPLIPPTSTAFDEECLYLNLWVPVGCADKGGEDGLAVMVWIHGGGLQWGSSTVPTYNGQVLASTQCVIVASMNYRLGVLGFLSLGIEEAPGNMGLVDQIMALQWIHDNAHNFGGSPDRITIFGESAGAVSVGYHMVSPLAQNLFSRAILQSGTAISRFAMATVSENAAKARELASLLGCPVADEKDVLRCLSEADSTEMGRILSDVHRFSPIAFGVVVDGHYITKPIVESYHAKEAHHVDVMAGFTEQDASFLLPLIAGKTMNESSRPVIDQTAFYDFIKNVLCPYLPYPPTDDNLFAKLLEYVYVNSSLPDGRDGYHMALEQILSDINFVCPAYTLVASLPGARNAYLYSFEHRSSISPFPEWMGVVHASELDFVFGRPLDQSDLFTEEERQLSSFMMRSWANFAKFGNPNSEDAPVQWPPFEGATYPYAAYRSPGQVSVSQGPRYRECAFWNEVYPALVDRPPVSPAVHKHDEM